MRRLFFLLVFLATLAARVQRHHGHDGQHGEDPLPADTAAPPVTPSAAQVERGRYLALAGNCAGCHTTRVKFG